jgi:hypothetical protein
MGHSVRLNMPQIPNCTGSWHVRPQIAAMLSLPFHRHHLRRTVWVTLLAWGLALLAGINACQVQPRAPRATASAASPRDGSADRGMHPTQSRHVEHGHQVGHPEHDGPATDAAKAGCLKFYDDESSTVAKGKLAQPDVPGPVVAARVDWRSAVPAVTVATWRLVERPASQGPLLFIRFLRLTI